MDVGLIHCAEPECPATIKNHRWGKTKADGWFFSRRDDTAFCPDHIPPWVAEWRAQKLDSQGEDHA